ncbi:rRNA 2'-O-methyltransferase fibrillarin-like [Bombus impatiens]|uniref:rRNA 2'-O-methyltransferase fibrillarin-like n=1 Tax=Bombus impatiens TaxID=132113 RepID=A0A6P3UUD7_BOMIM|nr:rRNA 2'-O-methyltransferase fibrillarin-like [Bombus impatiens]
MRCSYTIGEEAGSRRVTGAWPSRRRRERAEVGGGDGGEGGPRSGKRTGVQGTRARGMPRQRGSRRNSSRPTVLGRPGRSSWRRGKEAKRQVLSVYGQFDGEVSQEDERK